MTTNSELLKSISVSFDANGTPRNCAVEINLNLEVFSEDIEEPGHILLTENNDKVTGEKESSPESRNDRENLSPLTIHASSIFRRHNRDGNFAGKSCSLSPVSRIRSESFERNRSEDGTGDVRRTASVGSIGQNSSTASRVKSSAQLSIEHQSSTQEVTHASGEATQSIDFLYDELRKMASASFGSSDDDFVGKGSSLEYPGSSDEAKRSVFLQIKAEEMIQEARKACASFQDDNFSIASDGNYHPIRDESLQDKIIDDANPTDLFQRKIKRTKSLDRALSTKEVLEFATQTLEQKGKSMKKFSEEKSRPSDNSKGGGGRITAQHPSAEQEEMTRRQAESGMRYFSLSKDNKVTDTLLRIHAKNLGLQSHSLSKACSPKEWETGSICASDTEEHDEIDDNLPPFISKDSLCENDKVLKRLDGIKDAESGDAISIVDDKVSAKEETMQSNSPWINQRKQLPGPFSIMKFLWGGGDEEGEDDGKGLAQGMLACGPITGRRQLRQELQEERGMSSAYESKFASLMGRKHRRDQSFPEAAYQRLKADRRMRDWIDNQFEAKGDAPADGSYALCKSRTVVVHEIVRGNWTWCTAWSPDGSRLAVATENHHLAIIDTTTSVWRVKHDKRIVGRIRNDSTHSIRAIAWGAAFIAIGGTGDAVTILATSEPYPVLHKVKGTGFVGSLDWRIDSTVLAIGSRNNQAMLVKVQSRGNSGSASERQLESQMLHTIVRRNWVNSVAFSPGGIFFALGDAGGQLSIYRYEERLNSRASVKPVASFTMEDAILALSFSPDGRWLYSGGEDFRLTCIDTNHWEIVHRLRRNRWVQCLASSRSGTHLACGGVTSEVSILEVGLGWDTVINIELKGLVPLSASWHPRDQFLALTGQNQSILVVETTDARHVPGHCLRSISSILAVDFSPDGGRMAVIGNEQGIVTFYKLQGGSFETVYELVVTIKNSLSIRWSPNGKFVVVATRDLVLIVGRSQPHDVQRNRPANMSGFSIRKVIRGLGDVKSVALDSCSRYIAVSGAQTRILDVKSDYKCVRFFEAAGIESSAWSPDGRWVASIGQSKSLTIYDTDFDDCQQWQEVVSLEGTHAGLAVAFGPTPVDGLVYLAFGGDDRCISIVEIRTREGTWETVLKAPRDGAVHDLDWNSKGLLAAAIGNGTVSVMDLSYLQSGLAVNELNYKAQRQALTCFTEIRRNRGKNSMRTVKWIPTDPGSHSMLAVGGSDGEVEILDLTQRDKCRGFQV